MRPAPRTVDEYLASVPPAARAPLQALRQMIREAAPGAEEVISYQVPTFKYGRAIVSFGAAKHHCAFYVMSPAVMEAHREDLKDYDTAKGTVRFLPGQPLPTELVVKLVKARIAENEAAGKR